MKGRKSGLMPSPVSVTVTCALDATRSILFAQKTTLGSELDRIGSNADDGCCNCMSCLDMGENGISSDCVCAGSWIFVCPLPRRQLSGARTVVMITAVVVGSRPVLGVCSGEFGQRDA